MNKKGLRSPALVGFFVAFLLLSSCSTVLATKPVAITFFEEPDPAGPPVSSKEAGINLMLVIENTGEITGDITGPFSVHREVIFHKAQIGPEKMTTAQADFQIEADYDGKEGMINLRLTYKIIVQDGLPVSSTGNWVIIGATGELANLHGQGTFTIDYTVSPPIRQFSGQVHFDP